MTNTNMDRRSFLKGAGGISKFHFAFVNFSASKMSSPSPPVPDSAPGSLGAQPARPRPATAAMPTPALVMNCRRVYFPIFHSLVVGVFAPG